MNTLKYLLCAFVGALTLGTASAGDEGVRDNFEAAPGVRVQIRGRDRDVITVTVDGQQVHLDRLYGRAKRAGSLGRGDFAVQDLGNGAVNIAFRFGSDKDLMSVIAVRGKSVIASNAYWMHPKTNPVAMDWVKPDLVRFSRDGVDKHILLEGGRWILR